MSGKKGQYRYYRCATKSYSDPLSCDCPNIPKEELERAVLEVVANTVLQPERISKLLEEFRQSLVKAREPDIRRLRALQRDASLQTERITVLYDQTGSGAIELDDSLRDYLRNQQRKLSTINQEIEVLQRRQQLPLRKFGSEQVGMFADAVRKELLDPGSVLVKPYLRAVVQEIRIRKKDAVIIGNTAQLAAAVSKWKPGTPSLEVPGFVSEWRDVPASNWDALRRPGLNRLRLPIPPTSRIWRGAGARPEEPAGSVCALGRIGGVCEAPESNREALNFEDRRSANSRQLRNSLVPATGLEPVRRLRDSNLSSWRV